MIIESANNKKKIKPRKFKFCHRNNLESDSNKIISDFGCSINISPAIKTIRTTVKK